MLPTKFRFIQLSGFRRRLFRTEAIRNKSCLWQPCFLTNWAVFSKFYRGPSTDAFYQVSIHLKKQFQRRRFFRTRPIRNKNCLWRLCLLTYDQMRTKLAIFIEDLPYMFPTKFRFFQRCSFRREDFFKDICQSETRIACGGHVC